MKTHKNLFPRIISFENLLLAAFLASKNKRNRPNVIQFNKNLEDNLFLLQEQLINRTYQPGEYDSFYIFEPKKRLISAAPFRDRVVHHALCNIIEPFFEKSFIFDTYANRVNKGTHRAINRFQKYLRQYCYLLKCDIKKYFPSIDHEILKAEIRRKIADQQTLWLIDLIIDSSNPQEPVLDYFPGDDLLTPIQRRKGLPIGNLTSQFFANVFLNRFDHFVTENLGFSAYVRYVDDFVIFSDNKQILSKIYFEIEKFLTKFRLKLKRSKCHIFKNDVGIEFLGQRIFPTHRLLKKSNVRRFCKRLKKFNSKLTNGEMSHREVQQRIASWLGHAKQADTFRLRNDLTQKFTIASSYLVNNKC